MELPRLPAAEETVTTCDPGPPDDRSETMTAWREEARAALSVQDDLPEEAAPGELLRRLTALHLAEHRYKLPPSVRSSGDPKPHFPDARYPEPLSTEESPRRRARSLPCTVIPEAAVEEDEDSILCCWKLKKKVQFADSLGFSLASVKHFVPSDEPLVPAAVLARLQSCPPAVPEVAIMPELEERADIGAELQTRLDGQRVCLEQVVASVWGVSGHILVKAPADDAQVRVRYTFNDWLSFLDCPASATQQGPAPGTQRFHFTLCYPPFTSRLHFAICLTAPGQEEIWDNNQGANYTVSCQQTLAAVGLPSRAEENERPRLW